VPATALAVAVTLATPLAFVVALGALRPAVAPVVGAAKATVTFGTTLPFASSTIARSGEAKGVPTVVVCAPPAPTLMEAGAPGVFVREKDVVVATPAAAAVTA
jgi:hypothetical protein